MKTLGNVAVELRQARRLAADRRSFLRWATDILIYRLLRIWRPRASNRIRTIAVKGDAKLSYRLNRGDVLTLCEVWIHEVYRVPSGRASTLVDLGANIGLASVWLAKRYGCRRVVAVEPLPENIELLRRNLEQNGIEATVMDCAVGGEEGEGFLAVANEPNGARLAPDGLPVRVASMSSVVQALGEEGADLVKIDIEGAEAPLFEGERRWMDGVGTIVVEIHDPPVDTRRVVSAVESHGLRGEPCGRNGQEGSIRCFTRPRVGRARPG